MGKVLAEMTLEELWELFPVFLIEPDEKWKKCYSVDLGASEVKSRCCFRHAILLGTVRGKLIIGIGEGKYDCRIYYMEHMRRHFYRHRNFLP